MLKLHHLNLMNEIQETALMLNLYEQQQLARQQQQEEMRKARQMQLAKKGLQSSSCAKGNNVPGEIIVGEDASQKKRNIDDDAAESNKRQK